MTHEGKAVMIVIRKENQDEWKSGERPLPVNADREAERDAGEKALWALVSLGWLWLQDAHPGRKTRRKQQQQEEEEEKETEEEGEEEEGGGEELLSAKRKNYKENGLVLLEFWVLLQLISSQDD